VLITVQGMAGFTRTVRTDTLGFYTVTVQVGSISITASKAGYVTRASQVDMGDSTVLNFSLTPETSEDIPSLKAAGDRGL
jgi:carboxypeptidase family protein